MDEANQASQQGEPRTYRFISDRFHKENLSGRVRAACITCRRRKVKCEGVEPCRTCNEKGLVCEGLPKRKQSDPDPSRVPPSGISDSRGTKRASQDALLRPDAQALHKEHKSDDSGYESIKMPRSQAASPTNATSPTEDRSSSSQSQRQPPRGFQFVNETCGTGSDVDNRTHSRSFDETTRMASAGVSRGPLQRPETNKLSEVRSQDQEQGSVSLMTTARALEEQARSLRLLATQQDSAVREDEHSPHSTTGYPIDFVTQRAPQQPLDLHQPLPGDLTNLFPQQHADMDFSGLPEPNSPEWWSLYNDTAQHHNAVDLGAGYDPLVGGFSSQEPMTLNNPNAFTTQFTNNPSHDHYSWQFAPTTSGT